MHVNSSAMFLYKVSNHKERRTRTCGCNVDAAKVVQRKLGDKEVRNIYFVPGRVVNIVTK